MKNFQSFLDPSLLPYNRELPPLSDDDDSIPPLELFEYFLLKASFVPYPPTPDPPPVFEPKPDPPDDLIVLLFLGDSPYRLCT